MFGRADAFYGVDVCRPISSSLQQGNSYNERKFVDHLPDYAV